MQGLQHLAGHSWAEIRAFAYVTVTLIVGIAHRAAHVGSIAVSVDLHLVVVLLEEVGAGRGGDGLLGPLPVAGIAWILGPTYCVANVVPATSREWVVTTPKLASDLLICGSSSGD